MKDDYNLRNEFDQVTRAMFWYKFSNYNKTKQCNICK